VEIELPARHALRKGESLQVRLATVRLFASRTEPGR